MNGFSAIPGIKLSASSIFISTIAAIFIAPVAIKKCRSYQENVFNDGAEAPPVTHRPTTISGTPSWEGKHTFTGVETFVMRPTEENTPYELFKHGTETRTITFNFHPAGLVELHSDGRVTVKDITLDEGARVFWDLVTRAFPKFKKTICEGAAE